MQAHRLLAPGLAGLQAGQVPDPPAPGRGDVLVHMRAAWINFRDLMFVPGAFGARLPTGQVQLSDGQGVDRVLDFAQAGQALRHFAERRPIGKVVIRID